MTRWWLFWLFCAIFGTVNSYPRLKRREWDIERWNKDWRCSYVACLLLPFKWHLIIYSMTNVLFRYKMVAILGSLCQLWECKIQSHFKETKSIIKRWNALQIYINYKLYLFPFLKLFCCYLVRNKDIFRLLVNVSCNYRKPFWI